MLDRRLLMLALAALVCGCMVGPSYERPALDVPETYKEPASTDIAFANVPWWELFQDPVLVNLVEQALANNKDLGVAVARIEEAAATVNVVRANQFPFVDAAGSAGRLRESKELFPTAESRDDFFIGAAASFEIDLWGKLRRATEAARADLLAAQANARNVTITLVATVATSYFLLLDLDDRLAISRRTRSSREESLRIIEARFDRGTVPELDVNQADIEAADADAAVAAFERLVRQAENAISVLVGSSPRELTRGVPLGRQAMQVDVPAGLPIELLERRPDVLAAEELLAAETARVGVRRALRLPSLALTGSYGAASQDLSDLLSGDSATWGFFGNVFAPLFNSGQLKSAERAQRQRAEQARLAYEQAVLDALRDVDDSLTAVRTLRAEHTARLRQLRAAQNAARLSRARYDGGIVSYLEVLDSERSLFQAELLESETRQQQLSAVVRLYRALGGGWPAFEAP
jgi:multidrug efflux system outer membrane protein